MHQPMDMNPDVLDSPIRRPRLAYIVFGLFFLIFFGIVVHGWLNTAPSPPGNLNISPDEATLPPEPPDTAIPEFARHDPSVPPNIAQSEEEPPRPEIDRSPVDRELAFLAGVEEFRRNNPPGSDLVPISSGNNIVSDTLTTRPEPSAATPREAARQRFLRDYYNNQETKTLISEIDFGDAEKPGTSQVPVADAPPPQGGAGESVELLRALNASSAPPIFPPPSAPADAARYDAQNAQGDKISFAYDQSSSGSIYNSFPAHRAPSPFIIRSGTFVPIIFEAAVNSDLPGIATGLVQQNIYDSINQNILLIPRGSRVILEYNTNVRAGQERIQLAARRVLLPDLSSIELDGAIIHDLKGKSGLGEDDIDIDRHYDKLVATGALAGLLEYAIQKAQPENPGPDLLASLGLATSESVDSIADTIIRRTLDRQPTLEVPAGTNALIILTKDILIPPVIS